MTQNLNEKAMLVKLSISQWTARKYDKKVSNEIDEKYNAQSAGRYNKILIAEEEIKKIAKTANEARTFHYFNTLPWDDNGSRILPSANFQEYSQKMRELRNNFERTATSFCDTYPFLRDAAKTRLNGLYNPADYPSIDQIRSKYQFHVQIDPIPDAQDFRVALHNDDISRIQTEISSRAKQNAEAAMTDLWKRLFNAVSHMADKLKDKDAVFRDSLVTNLIDLTAILPKLNIGNDPILDKMRKEVETRLCTVMPKELRESDSIRGDVARDANNILDAMAGYMGT